MGVYVCEAGVRAGRCVSLGGLILVLDISLNCISNCLILFAILF